MDITPKATEDLRVFKEQINPLHLLPLWERKVKLTPGSECVPALWAYQNVRPMLERACQLINKKDADRRVLVMENPSMRGSSFIAKSLFAGQQIILPGELAPSHRHTPNAFRFIVEGEGAYTSIDGIQIMMRPGDFIVTPNWAWHDHGNLGDSPVVWMDGLDTPFTSLFGAHFRDNYPQDTYPVRHQSLTPDEVSKTYLYPFTEMSSKLMDCSASQLDTSHAYKLKYLNPLTQEDPLMTVSAFMQRIPQGFIGTPYRSTENTVFNLAKGACRIEVGEQVFLMQEHDVLVVPSWETYRIAGLEESYLFSFTDRIAQQKLGFWREEYLLTK